MGCQRAEKEEEEQRLAAERVRGSGPVTHRVPVPIPPHPVPTLGATVSQWI